MQSENPFLNAVSIKEGNPTLLRLGISMTVLNSALLYQVIVSPGVLLRPVFLILTSGFLVFGLYLLVGSLYYKYQNRN